MNLNPYNIKNHSDAQIDLQKKNLKKVGYLGGIVYNELSGNLIDGHRRVLALDIINKYDGTPETDYDIKVEVATMDDKMEKEQMAFMALANSKADFNLIANFIDDVDYKNMGLSESEYEQIMLLKPTDEMEMETFGMMEIMEEEFAPKKKDEVLELPVQELTSEELMQVHEEMPHADKEEISAKKAKNTDVGEKRLSDSERFVVINFDDMEQKRVFCEALGLQQSRNMVISGREMMEKLDL